MRVIGAMAIAGCVAAAGCAEVQSGAYSAVPMAPPGGPTEAVLLGGQIVAVQTRGNTVAAYLRNGQVAAGLGADLFVSISNRSNHDIEFRRDDLSVQASTAGGSRRLASVSRDRMLADTTRSYADRTAVETLLGGLRASAAFARASHYTVTGNTLVRDAVGVGWHRPEYTVYDTAAGRAAADAEDQKTKLILDELATKRDAAIGDIQSFAIAQATIPPGQTVVAMLRTQPDPDAEPAAGMVATLRLDGEDYAFDYKLMRNGTP